MLFCHFVVPHAGTWIEITKNALCAQDCEVVPHAGTWIEIINFGINSWNRWSFPTRERGLKSVVLVSPLKSIVVPHAGTWIEICSCLHYTRAYAVVPHAGTWIEIAYFVSSEALPCVVPHAGTWIEMSPPISISASLPSFPTRERGLKCQVLQWVAQIGCRSPRGNVD